MKLATSEDISTMDYVVIQAQVLLPLARQRLTAEDLAAIGRNMAARREDGESEPG